MTQILRWDYHAQVALFLHLCNLPEAGSVSSFLCGVRGGSFAVPREQENLHETSEVLALKILKLDLLDQPMIDFSLQLPAVYCLFLPCEISVLF